jgi:hypothetical protein
VAAEIWGVSVDHVLDRIRGGEVISKSENGFVFVDVDHASRAAEVQHPPTYTLVTRAEMRALNGDDDEFEASDESLPTNVSWREVRQTVGRQRRAPISAS